MEGTPPTLTTTRTPMEDLTGKANIEATVRSRSLSGRGVISSPPAPSDKFCWKKFLSANPDRDLWAAPVHCFRHAHLNEQWDRIAIPELSVEYPVGKGVGRLAAYGKIYWIGITLEYFGYLAKVQAEGYPKKFTGKVPTHWKNYVTEVHRIGTVSRMVGAVLIPPLAVMDLEKDWRIKVISDLHKGITAPILKDMPLASGVLKIGATIEALDNHCVSRMKVGTVLQNIGGRVFVKYWDSDSSGDNKSSKDGLWCHEASGWVNAPGWSKTVGHDISHPEGYAPKPISKLLTLQGKRDPEIDLQVGMKLEAVDPLKPNLITAATVAKVLKFGYIMVSFSTSEEDDGPPVLDKMIDNVLEKSGQGNDWFCYHYTSPLIFYCGFAKDNGIPLNLSKEYKSQEGAFDWDDYLKRTGAVAMDLKMARPYNLTQGFKPGMKLEATDLVDSRLICVATIAAVKGRLLKIHFDGWDPQFDQWVDIFSHDIFPVGWCELLGYPLQGPMGSEFWKRFKRPDTNGQTIEEFKTNGLREKHKGNNRSPLPPLILDHDQTKAEAVKLGQKPKLLKRNSLTDEMDASNMKQLKREMPFLPRAKPTP